MANTYQEREPCFSFFGALEGIVYPNSSYSRVMEWLRHVDLSEYAPNLRGSGVHGALLVMEKRWTSQIFYKSECLCISNLSVSGLLRSCLPLFSLFLPPSLF